MEIDSKEEEKASASANLFDLRLIIGGLFTLYGVILTIVGALDSPAEVDKAAGVRINLWMGLGMLVLGLLFLLWVRLSPLHPETSDSTPPPPGPTGAGAPERT
jgi:xanthine/uracil/vitamin C permease (AzgA family)